MEMSACRLRLSSEQKLFAQPKSGWELGTIITLGLRERVRIAPCFLWRCIANAGSCLSITVRHIIPCSGTFTGQRSFI